MIDLSAKSTHHRRYGQVAKKLIHSWRLYVLLIPAILYFVIFCYYPMYGVQIAFRDYMAKKGIWGSNWVGLKHFKYLLNMPMFSTLMSNTIVLSLMTLALTFPMPILLALLLNEARSKTYKKLVQNLTYAPNFISTVVLVGMIQLFTVPSTGVINNLIEMLGGERISFMTSPVWFRWLYSLSAVWQTTGWNSILYLAALSGIDPTLYEAAQIDGASRFQRLIYINLPSLVPTIIILLIMNIGSVMNVGFEKVYLMQNSINAESSEVIATYVYKIGLINGKLSFSSAVGLFNSLINFGLLVVTNAIARRAGEVSLW